MKHSGWTHESLPIHEQQAFANLNMEHRAYASPSIAAAPPLKFKAWNCKEWNEEMRQKQVAEMDPAFFPQPADESFLTIKFDYAYDSTQKIDRLLCVVSMAPNWTPPPEFGNDPDSAQLGTQWSQPSFSADDVIAGVTSPMNFPGHLYTVGFDYQRGAHKVFSDKVSMDIETSMVYRQYRGTDHPNPEKERVLTYQNMTFPKEELRRMSSLAKAMIASNISDYSTRLALAVIPKTYAGTHAANLTMLCNSGRERPDKVQHVWSELQHAKPPT